MSETAVKLEWRRCTPELLEYGACADSIRRHAADGNGHEHVVQLGRDLVILSLLKHPTAADQEAGYFQKDPVDIDHEHKTDRCCYSHNHHVMPHRGCILR
jgi:hypothetical protein